MQATISATNQLFEASQKEWLLTSQELRQQLETLQALPPPPPPSTPPPVAEKTSVSRQTAAGQTVMTQL